MYIFRLHHNRGVQVKSVILTVILTLVSAQTFGATIREARLDSSKQNILLTVTYGGGCGQHDFTLDLQGCQGNGPLHCKAELVHRSHDVCEALIQRRLVINLAEYGLNSRIYKKSTLTITGDQDWRTKRPSAATVTLP